MCLLLTLSLAFASELIETPAGAVVASDRGGEPLGALAEPRAWQGEDTGDGWWRLEKESPIVTEVVWIRASELGEPDPTRAEPARSWDDDCSAGRCRVTLRAGLRLPPLSPGSATHAFLQRDLELREPIRACRIGPVTHLLAPGSPAGWLSPLAAPYGRGDLMLLPRHVRVDGEVPECSPPPTAPTPCDDAVAAALVRAGIDAPAGVQGRRWRGLKFDKVMAEVWEDVVLGYALATSAYTPDRCEAALHRAITERRAAAKAGTDRL